MPRRPELRDVQQAANQCQRSPSQPTLRRRGGGSRACEAEGLRCVTRYLCPGVKRLLLDGYHPRIFSCLKIAMRVASLASSTEWSLRIKPVYIKKGMPSGPDTCQIKDGIYFSPARAIAVRVAGLASSIEWSLFRHLFTSNFARECHSRMSRPHTHGNSVCSAAVRFRRLTSV